jgi:hypothetical protein
LIGDAHHDFEMIQEALHKTLVQGAGLSIEFTDDVTRLNAQTLGGYKLLITLREHIPTLTGAQQAAVKQFVAGGGGALFLHNSSAIARSPSAEVVREVIGGAFVVHSEIKEYRVEITNRDHPITKGVEDFVVRGEQHFVEYDKDPKYLFLRNVDREGKPFKNYGVSSPAGWAYDYGRGRVCFMSPGHTAEVLCHPAYAKLQQNAVRWLLQRRD